MLQEMNKSQMDIIALKVHGLTNTGCVGSEWVGI